MWKRFLKALTRLVHLILPSALTNSKDSWRSSLKERYKVDRESKKENNEREQICIKVTLKRVIFAPSQLTEPFPRNTAKPLNGNRQNRNNKNARVNGVM